MWETEDAPPRIRNAPGRFDNYRCDHSVEQALSLCFDGQLYRSADALIADAALMIPDPRFLQCKCTASCR